MNTGGMASPGQREIRTFGAESEVKVPLQQWKWATMAALVLAAVFQVFIVKRVGMWARGLLPGSWVTSAETTIAWLLLFLALAVPAVAVFSNFLINLYDSNHPAPKQALPSDYGPTAPGWLRWLSGWREREPAPQPAPQQEYQGRSKGIPDPSQTIVRPEVIIQVAGSKKNVRACPDLTLEDWNKLATYLRKGNRSVSQSDLENLAHFSHGRGGRGRVVNQKLTQWQGLTRVGEQGKPMLIDEFAAWVVNRGYAEGLPSPTE